jgi:hypothetical protein
MTPAAIRNAVAVLALAGALSPAVAGETESTFGVGVVAGFDSNPLLVSDDGPSGAFAQLRLDGGVTRYVGAGSAAAFFLDGHVATRADEGRTSDAGHDGGDLRLGVALSPGFAGHRLVVSTGGRLAAYRGTFTDRATGRVYEAAVAPPTDPPSTMPIPDRLDFDSSGAFLNLRWKQGPRLTWSLETSWDHTDYVEDYEHDTDLDPLDYRSLTVRPGASLRLGDLASLALRVALTDLDYDDRPALDEAGTEVPGTTRTYHYAQYQLLLQVKPAEPWSLHVALGAGGRDDEYAGYYDSVSRSGSIALGRHFGRKSQLRLVASLRDVEYDHATVSGDPADDIRGSDEQRFAGRFTRTIGEHLRWFVEGGTRQTDGRDPVFAYDRDWVITGFRYGR